MHNVRSDNVHNNHCITTHIQHTCVNVVVVLIACVCVMCVAIVVNVCNTLWCYVWLCVADWVPRWCVYVGDWVLVTQWHMFDVCCSCVFTHTLLPINYHTQHVCPHVKTKHMPGQPATNHNTNKQQTHIMFTLCKCVVCVCVNVCDCCDCVWYDVCMFVLNCVVFVFVPLLCCVDVCVCVGDWKPHHNIIPHTDYNTHMLQRMCHCLLQSPPIPHAIPPHNTATSNNEEHPMGTWIQTPHLETQHTLTDNTFLHTIRTILDKWLMSCMTTTRPIAADCVVTYLHVCEIVPTCCWSVRNISVQTMLYLCGFAKLCCCVFAMRACKLIVYDVATCLYHMRLVTNCGIQSVFDNIDSPTPGCAPTPVPEDVASQVTHNMITQHEPQINIGTAPHLIKHVTPVSVGVRRSLTLLFKLHADSDSSQHVTHTSNTCWVIILTILLLCVIVLGQIQTTSKLSVCGLCRAPHIHNHYHTIATFTTQCVVSEYNCCATVCCSLLWHTIHHIQNWTIPDTKQHPMTHIWIPAITMQYVGSLCPRRARYVTQS